MLLKFNAILKNFLADKWMRGIKLKGDQRGEMMGVKGGSDGAQRGKW